ncbi:MAG TPA: hypothetical protein DCY13_04640, partial [Verrucomicrobiales bacterium]|nr:hypothetical protein [Verrucomicrobiales bacterium]
MPGRGARVSFVPRIIVSLALGAMLLCLTQAGAAAVDYAQHIKPLLAKHCYECHGPQKQKSNLRLDAREYVFHSTDAEDWVIQPRLAKESELLRRVAADDEDERMPPRGDRLRDDEIALLRSWIEAGAAWPEDEPPLRHWAYERPVQPALPASFAGEHPVDAFVRGRLREHGLDLSAPVSPAVLLRRLTLS